MYVFEKTYINFGGPQKYMIVFQLENVEGFFEQVQKIKDHKDSNEGFATAG